MGKGLLRKSPVGDPGYAAILRDAMAERRLTIRDLAQTTEYSYEHLRKCLAAIPVVSQALNKAVCKALGLDEHDLWTLAVAEKRRTRSSVLGVAESDQAGSDIARLWERLTPAEQGRLLRIADGWLATRETKDLHE